MVPLLEEDHHDLVTGTLETITQSSVLLLEVSYLSLVGQAGGAILSQLSECVFCHLLTTQGE